MKNKKINVDLAKQINRLESEHSATKLDTPLWRGRIVEQLTHPADKIMLPPHKGK